MNCYKLKVKGTIEEMIGMLEEMPEDITESCIFPMEKLGMQDLPKENPLYSERGLYVHLPVLGWWTHCFVETAAE